jgi:outer membrane protein assembly factor BamA
LFHQVLKVYYAKMVTFEVTERPLIVEIAYEAIDQATPEEIREEWRLQRIDLSVGSEFDPLKAKRAAAAIKRLLAKRGDQQAKVNSMVERRSPTNVSIVFKVEE